jgi:hypothetical protein
MRESEVNCGRGIVPEQKKWAGIGIAVLAVALAACSEKKLAGEVEINGRTSAVTGCQISPPGADKWVEVSTASGLRIRIVQQVAPTSGSGTKTDTIVQFVDPRNPAPVEARCRTKVTTSSTINGRTSGSVSLGTCQAANIVVSGKFTYGQCTQSGARQI